MKDNHRTSDRIEWKWKKEDDTRKTKKRRNWILPFSNRNWTENCWLKTEHIASLAWTVYKYMQSKNTLISLGQWNIGFKNTAGKISLKNQ